MSRTLWHVTFRHSIRMLSVNGVSMAVYAIDADHVTSPGRESPDFVCAMGVEARGSWLGFSPTSVCLHPQSDEYPKRDPAAPIIGLLWVPVDNIASIVRGDTGFSPRIDAP